MTWNLPTLHQVFIGNPGTGKTSIARLYGEMLKACGYLRKGHTVEVSAPLLISGYAGDLGSRLSRLVQEAIDGVLFIDEAYALTRRAGAANYEIIDTLTKAMEDYRNRLVVVVAGYPQEMGEFLAGNPGLQSRFADPILFSDLSPQEMGELLATYAAQENLELPVDVQQMAEAQACCTTKASTRTIWQCSLCEEVVRRDEETARRTGFGSLGSQEGEQRYRCSRLELFFIRGFA